MSWNKPGGNNDKDPWDSGGKDQSPPDLDEAFRKFKKKFNSSRSTFSNRKNGGGLDFLGIIFLIIILIWAGLGIYQVDQQEQAVVLKFGKYLETLGPGLHWNPPLIDTVQKVNVTKVRSSPHRGLMLTEDDNIVEVSLSVHWNVADPKSFLLEVREPQISLDNAAESSVRHVVGSVELHQILTEGRAQIAIDIQERTQRYLDNYQTGINITTVNIEDAQPPQEVQAAFDDVIRAKEDEARLKNEAETYRNGLVPEARGLAQRQLEEANAYKAQMIARAEGEVKRFNQLLKEYLKAPEVTRERLYLDTMQKIMQQSSKVMMDGGNSNLMYLPLDQIMNQKKLVSIPNNTSNYESSINKNLDSVSKNRFSSRRESR